jgi:hypothetical protein
MRRATILGLWQRTHRGVIRTYEVEYRLDGMGDKHRRLTTLAHLRELDVDRAVARVRRGAFGWRWVESLAPLGAAGPRPATD